MIEHGISRILAAAFGLAIFALVLRSALASSFATDEFTYAHAAWAIAQGEQPFRDFFLHHFPFSMQLGALAFLGNDDPRAIGTLRVLMVPFWVATALLASALNRRHGAWAAVLVAPLLATFYVWVQFGTQFRPDPTALAFFLGSVWFAGHRGSRARSAAFACGVCYVLAVWSSQKAVIYGAGLPLVWLVSAVQWRRAPAQPRLMREPLWVAAGVIAGALPIALYLSWTANWEPLWRWCFEWGVVHETRYPPRPKMASFAGTVREDGLVLALGLAGFALTLVRGLRSGRAFLADRDLLLALSAIGATASYFMQNAPYGWSLVAPLTFVAIFAARALSSAIDALVRLPGPRWLQPGAAALCVGVLAAGLPFEPRSSRRMPSRSQQETRLDAIARLTAPTDPVYDNTGAYVARPHAHYFFFTDKAARIVLAAQLVREIPAAIARRGVTVHLEGKRERGLPAELRRYLAEHFVPVLDGIRVWGRRFSRLAPGARASFQAVRTDEYYVSPERVAQSGELRLDGEPLSSAVVRLERGAHQLSWTGDEPSPQFALLWLPHDQRTREPLRERRKARKAR